MKYFKGIIILILLMSFLVIGTSYALWTQDSEIKFALTISTPPEEEFTCGTYDTIQEGIDLLKGSKYNFIASRLDNFANMLAARVTELNNLPVGGITWDELLHECAEYRDVANNKFGGYLNKYGQCINKLANFYNQSTPEEKAAVPDFWDQHTALWALHSQLWNKRSTLYTAINEVQEAGETKIK
ncbi:MAG: hypothetical protein GX922_02550 [Firmicutes bacterium]|nr:hypothetical protein [Bacillota bacterium]